MTTDPRPASALRAFLLALVGIGAGGLLVELALLEHWMATPQFVPLLTLGLVLTATVAVALRPGRRTLEAFRIVMATTVVAGLTGIGFHLYGNLAFEREMAPDASLGALILAAVHGATPLLAPGSLVQLGLVGLVVTYRHPALRSGNSRTRASDPIESKEYP